MTLRRLHRNLIQLLNEQVTVFRIHDCFYRSTQNLHTVFLQNTFLKQVSSAVQSCLTTESQEDTIGAFLLNHTSHKISSDRQEINLISNTFRCLDSSNIRVNQHRADAFLSQCLQSLRARIVKLACLANLQCARSQYQNLFQILFHNAILLFLFSVKKNAASYNGNSVISLVHYHSYVVKRVLASFFVFQKLCKVTKVFSNVQIYEAKSQYKNYTILYI